MRGVVVGVKRDRIAVRVDSGITVFDVMGAHETELGDVIAGDLETHGGEDLTNETKRETINAFIEAWSCDETTARDLMRLVGT